MFVKHYKGIYYRVVGHGRHTENGECLSIYQGIDGVVRVMPRELFEGCTEDGQKRFVAVTADDFPNVHWVFAFAALRKDSKSCEQARQEADDWNRRTSVEVECRSF